MIATIRQHLSAVENSPDWADLAEILAWYKQDVRELLQEIERLREVAPYPMAGFNNGWPSR